MIFIVLEALNISRAVAQKGKQITRGYSCVADEWAGMYNPPQLPQSPQSQLRHHKCARFLPFQLKRERLTNHQTNGPTDRPRDKVSY